MNGNSYSYVSEDSDNGIEIRALRSNTIADIIN